MKNSTNSNTRALPVAAHTPRFHVTTAYACNDLSRVRKGAQDVIGYDVRERASGIVYVSCDTKEDAEFETATLNKEELGN